MKILLGLVLMISFTVVANLLMKMGSMAPLSERLFGFLHWNTIAGLTAFACAGLFYAWILQWLPLNVAQSFAAAQFVAVILASALVLSESIPFVRWFGIAMIASGILIVGLSGYENDQPPSVPDIHRSN